MDNPLKPPRPARSSCHTFFLLLVMLSGMILSAQDEVRFTYPDDDAGLKSNAVACLLQDQNGFLWVGGQDGLFRFDGLRFEAFEPDPDDPNSISDKYVRAMTEDPRGYLWVGAYNGGLNRFDPATQTFQQYRRRSDRPESLGSDGIIALLVADETLWVGTYGGGLSMLPLAEDTGPGAAFQHFRHDPDQQGSISNDNIQAIHKDRSGRYWVATWGGGLNRREPDGAFTHFLHDPKDPTSISEDRVFCLTEDGRGRLWIGTWGGGLCLLEADDLGLDRPRFKRIPLNPAPEGGGTAGRITAIQEDGKGRLWLGDYGDGLLRLDPDSGQVEHWRQDTIDPFALRHNNIFTLYKDRWDILWVGSFGGGLARYDTTTSGVRNYRHHPLDPNSLGPSDVMCTLVDQSDAVWIGTDGGGLDRIRQTPDGPSYTHFQHDPTKPDGLAGEAVFVLLEDSRRQLWVGYYGAGLSRLRQDGSDGFQHYGPEQGLHTTDIWSLAEDDEGAVWIGSYGDGLIKMTGDPAAPQFTHIRHNPEVASSISLDFVSTLYCDSLGNVWVGTDGEGLNQLPAEDKHDPNPRFRRHRHETGVPGALSHNNVRVILESSDGFIWVATMGGGLNRLDPRGETFRVWRKRDGLSDDNLQAMIQDDAGLLWLASNDGLDRFDPATEQVLHFDTADGLVNHRYNPNAFKAKNGDLFFGGVKGVDRFDPTSMVFRDPQPRLVITDFRLSRGRRNAQADPVIHIGGRQDLTLDWRDADFSFEFALLDLRRPRENHLAYKLEGFEDHWNQADAWDRKARYTNIPAGAYTLKIKATNPDGRFQPVERDLNLQIHPPWWRTTPAIVLFYLLGALILVGFYFLRISILKQRHAVLEDLVHARTAEIERQKAEIERQSTELQDANRKLVRLGEFKDIMTGMIVHDLKNPINVILAFSERAMVREAAEKMLHLVLNILDVQKFEDAAMVLNRRNASIYEAAEGAVKQVAAAAGDQRIKIRNEIPTHLAADMDPVLIERVFANLLANAVRHTPKDGYVVMVGEVCGERVRLEVRDTGEGVPETMREKIFEKFAQVEGGAKQSQTTGLGLTYCKLAVAAHGGDIGVDPGVGSGAVFWFHLPAGRPLKPQSPRRNQDVPEDQLSPEQKARLAPYLDMLAELPVYKISRINRILADMEADPDPQIHLWLEQLKAAVHHCDSDRYQELLKP